MVPFQRRVSTGLPEAESHTPVRPDRGKVLYDLHIHSSFSDGRLDVKPIVELALQAQLSGISLTDHDTVAGLQLAHIQTRAAGLVFVPGIELNTDWEEEEVHILGYFINAYDSLLVKRLEELKYKRQQRARSIVEKINKMGLELDFGEVRRLAGSDLIGRPHIARALVEQGHVANEKEAFDMYIGRGCPAFVPRYNFQPLDAVQLVRRSGGLAFLAHPGKIKDKSIINMMIDYGICGLEVYYPEHDRHETEFLLEIAERNGLLASGGSDFHGPGSGDKRETLGLSGLKEDEFQRILKYWEGKAK